VEDEEDRDPRLTQLSTQWTLVFQAHQGTPEEVAAAQVELMSRYGGAVQRYLLAALRDPEAAEELNQEFALRFLRGDFHRADPTRGRFRDFVKRALRNLMNDELRRRMHRPRPMGDALPEQSEPADDDSEFDRRFLASWRAEILARAWAAIARLQEETGQPYHTVLRLRVAHPELHSPDLAARLSTILDRPISAGGLRMALQRSRDQFVKFLKSDVAGGLHEPTPDHIDEELIALGLYEYCKPAAKRRRSAE
jgi:DNA-directed RNA polymerase specialized sigma24 family protein